MIRLQGISKRYPTSDGTFYALKGIDLQIGKGESVAIRGRSGAGKSTLLHILGCLDTYSEGKYLLDGEDISEKSLVEAAKLRNRYFGFVLQDFSLINRESALYNVMSPMFFNKTPIREMHARAMAALEAMGIADQAKKNVLAMSGGQRQRVAIARAIVCDPPILLADEPTGSLDSTTEEEIMRLLYDLNQKGKTLLIVTHDDSVAAYCKRTVTLSDGKITEDITRG